MNKSIPLLQLSLLAGIAFGLSSCDTVSNAASGVGDAVSGAVSALDPTTWFGGSDDSAPPPPAADADSTAPSADATASAAPDLANLPAKPPTSTPAQQQAAAQSLAADGAQTGYSADSLRAGTEAAAAPPPAADMPPSAQLALNTPPSASAPPSAAPPSDMPPTTDSAPPSSGSQSSAPPSAQASPPPSAVSQTALAAPPSALTQGTGAQGAAAVPSAGSLASSTAPSAAFPARSAAIAPVTPPGAEPAVPAVPANMARRGGAVALSSQVASDASLGFRPSSAPPLDPSINQWVAAPMLARYRQTASASGIAPVRIAAVPQKGGMGMGGPETMSGAVVANLDAISTGPAGTIAAMSGGAAPTAVIFFPGDGATLSPAARSEIRAAVDQFKAMGGVGSIRVVGHASSRTANMPVERHLEVIFDKSQARANAVAQALIHEGVPASRVMIEAVGDSQPVYYESMPQGEEGNRRAEIFVQG